jgi:hypothetical protein
MAGNTSTLGTLGAAWKARSDAPQAPHDALEGVKLAVTANGDASATAFTFPHGLKNSSGNGISPTSVQVTPRNAVSSALHHVSSVTTANVVVTFSAAPASGTDNISFYINAYK